MRFLFTFFLCIFTISSIYSLNYDSCQSIPSGTHNINDTISGVTNCFELSSNSFINCNNHQITGMGGYGFLLDSLTNVTLANCYISSFGDGVYINFSTNITLLNISINLTSNGIFTSNINDSTFYNVTLSKNGDGVLRGGMRLGGNRNVVDKLYLFDNDGFDRHGLYVAGNNNNISNVEGTLNYHGIRVWGSSFNNFFKNILFDGNDDSGIYIYSPATLEIPSNNYFTNLTLINNLRGIRFYSRTFNNTIVNSQIYNNSQDNILFSLSNNRENLFYNNYLGNISKINSDDWSGSSPNYFNYSTQGNIYLQGSESQICFDFGINSPEENCDYFPSYNTFILSTDNGEQKVKFPVNSFVSLSFMLSLLLLFFL